ncbi:DUF4037 domain-containing protein [Actinokineospora cianjurensis]|uniref:Uncharacterized protein DUF4037 n=1 Tax=Actinokineospora cianjurensis TaxID=585224 RepID=A0A421B757_9PSEU|nr:DUF4037 domain-containing protein [Actinokineospora cianjurensis]RLK60336.1 uncharacterized protein DUF4037 [Actinokineospora cianjurensis]
MIKGLDLARRFYQEAVAPTLDVPHSAGRLGSGSEVLGFDTAISADHEWGPRCQILVADPAEAERIQDDLSHTLPKTFLGYPTHFDANPLGSMAVTDGPVNHRIDVAETGTWAVRALGFNPLDGVTTFDWLSTPTQAFAEITAGAVFHDGLDVLHPLRAAIAWYPDDVWRYVLACQWQRLAQEEAFVGRAGEVGDELGSAVVAARQVRELMRLCLLLAKRYPPYSKWLGSAFAQLPHPTLQVTLRGVLAAQDYRSRGELLADAYEAVGALQNATGLTDSVDPTRRDYYERPYPVIRADRFVDALRDSLDAELRNLPLTGAVDQWVDSTDFLMSAALRRAATRLG